MMGEDGSAMYDDGNSGHDSVLLSMVQNYDWKGALARIQEYPQECQAVGALGRTPLHVACDHDAPAEVIQELTKAFPAACIQVGTTGMNPLHIACSSDHASTEMVRVLLLESAKANLAEQMCSMKDVDLDTPLHSACRCGASIEVLRLLLLVKPDVVHQRDYEGLTPLLRLWVREFVLLGDDVINGVKGPEDLTGELGEAWKKTTMLLYCAYFGSLKPPAEGATSTNKIFRPMHAIAAIDCPRRVVKIATIVYGDQLLVRDENGMTPLLIASQAPIYKFQDIAHDGSDLEDRLEDHLYAADDDAADNNEMACEEDPKTSLPSVINILMEAEPAASRIADPGGKLPLQHAIDSGKGWNQGVKALTEVDGLEQNLERSLKITADESK
jgi:Ankyrin repeats (3 copies)